jgi:transcriptional regulator with XRE-family HTH domain
MTQQILLNIGKKIREIRQQQDITLQEIAETAQISKGMLSKIENGRTVPSLSVLLEIIAALKVNMSDFFAEIEINNTRRFIHIPKSAYVPFQKENRTGFLYHAILSQTINQGIMDVVILDLEPDCQRELVTTDGYELKYILKGQVVYQLGDETLTLNEGDTLFFDGRIPHVPMNKSGNKASMLVIYFLSPSQ